ncbi:hypothetical protein A2617_02775 [Candidatus Daviesbacteria bacterium RIFOXYD1_FULL_41_10]|uniref:MgsA AAA+ ATPase C-terminal domain-containing protein n=1 Tax=Candidatus Daviesbacteria bacterium RIFOXYD1_FULL_41_10 TaxID=1797801 RepID=A0A1F5N360_9BACT|nr:MAG: hypothetical protein A2617_02775 [Candidatus Daviesbacteria bacterium RIFOXYD1_FULL_41_10]
MAHEEHLKAKIIESNNRLGIDLQKSTSPSGNFLDEVISAAIKEIRVGEERNAAYWAYQMHISHPAAARFLWECYRVCADEDCGLANPQALGVVTERMRLYYDLPEKDPRRGFVVTFVTIYLARSPKSRFVNEIHMDLVQRIENGFTLEMPDRAIDMHTKRG